MKLERITRWLNSKKESASSYGIVTNQEWCNKELNRLKTAGISARIITSTRRNEIAIAK